MIGPLLDAGETAAVVAMYDDSERFRSTVEMARHRPGEGQYRYSARPYPEPIEEFKHALHPRLLPIAHDLSAKLNRAAPWPDTLNDWLEMCLCSGQTRSTALLLTYGVSDWNALPRKLYGEFVFAL